MLCRRSGLLGLIDKGALEGKYFVFGFKIVTLRFGECAAGVRVWIERSLATLVPAG